MQRLRERQMCKARLRKKEVIAELTKHFISGLANALAKDIDARIVECSTEIEGIYDRVIPIVKKRKRKKDSPRGTIIRCSITETGNSQSFD